MNDASSLAWYKQPLVWMLIAIPAAAVIAGMQMLYLAVTTDDGLVVEDYYKHGLLINDQIERDEAAWRLQLAAEVDINPDNGYIRVQLDPGALAQLPGSLQLALRHATQQRQDNTMVLYKQQQAIYGGTITNSIRKGVWYVEISDESGSEPWRLSQKARIDEPTRLRLLPLAPLTND